MAIRSRSSSSPVASFGICTLALALLCASSQAEQWKLNNNGTWFTGANWVSGTPANAVGAVADFSQLNINANRTVTLDGAATIGSLLLGDSDNTHSYIFANGTGGSITFNNGGTSYLTDAGSGANRLDGGMVVNDQLVISKASGTLEIKGVISGAGGITIDGCGLQLRNGSTNTYSGPTILNNGAQVMWKNGSGFTNESTNSNIIINDGIYNRYYDSNLTIPLGTGARQLQILGGTSGFSGNRNFGVTLNSGSYIAVWGSTYFNPNKLVLTSPWANSYGTTKLNNKLDLNGQDRTITILCDNATDTGYGQINNVIQDSAATGTGIIKEGPGVLLLAHDNTFTGGVEVKGGIIRVQHAGALGTQADGGLSFTGGGTYLDLRTNFTVKRLSSTATYYGAVTITNSSAYTLTVDQDVDTTFSGFLQDGYSLGVLSLTKTGTGTLTMSDAASYHSGATLISEGTFVLDQDWSSSYSNITVAAGASFGGSAYLGGDLTLENGAKLLFDPAKTLTVDYWNYGGQTTDLGNLSLANLVLTGATSVDDGTYVLIDGYSTIVTTNLQNFGAANAGTFEGKSAYFDIDENDDLVLVVSSSGPDPTTYAGWKTAYGLSGASANDDADDDGDGIPLLIEFALGGDPTAIDLSILPTMKMTQDTGSTYLELVVTRPIGLSGITYVPQTHTGMSSWPTDSTGIANASPTPVNNGNGTETVTYRRSQAISGAAAAFIRLKVTNP